MAIARLLAKSLSTSERRARLHQEAGPLAEFCQALYPLIVAHADDWGRLDGSVFHVKHAIDPTSPRSVEEFTTALAALDRVRLIEWYVVDSKPYVQVVDFKRHQPGLKQRHSSLPAFSELARRVVPGDAVECRGSPCDSNVLDLKRTEPIKNSGASAPRSPAENVSVITKIAHDVLDQLGPANPDLDESLKSRCAQLKIAYDGTTVRKALESALVQRTRGRA